MGETTKIGWCDHTASPWHGCEKVAPECAHCYAAAFAPRNPTVFGKWGVDGVRVRSLGFAQKLRRWNRQAEKTGKRVSVFPSICDPFEDRPELIPWREAMFEVIDECPLVDLLLLTKRPQNIRRMWPGSRRHNVRLGTSAGTMETAREFIPHLVNCRDLSPVLFVSMEPLLAPVDLRRINIAHKCPSTAITALSISALELLDWVIVGGESGRGARRCDVEWIDDIVGQCKAARVPVFVKQLGSKPTSAGHPFSLNHSKGEDPAEWDIDLRVQQFPEVANAA